MVTAAVLWDDVLVLWCRSPALGGQKELTRGEGGLLLLSGAEGIKAPQERTPGAACWEAELCTGLTGSQLHYPDHEDSQPGLNREICPLSQLSPLLLSWTAHNVDKEEGSEA